MADVNPNNGVTYSHIVRAEAMIEYEVTPSDVRTIFLGDELNEYEIFLAWCAGLTALAINKKFPYNRNFYCP